MKRSVRVHRFVVVALLICRYFLRSDFQIGHFGKFPAISARIFFLECFGSLTAVWHMPSICVATLSARAALVAKFSKIAQIVRYKFSFGKIRN